MQTDCGVSGPGNFREGVSTFLARNADLGRGEPVSQVAFSRHNEQM